MVVCATLLGISLAACSGRSGPAGDRISGSIIAVSASNQVDTTGPRVDIPPVLSRNVTSTNYRQDKWVGTKLEFTNLTFGELNALGDLIGQAFPATNVTMTTSAKRTGESVRFSGAADMSSLEKGSAKIVVTIEFAGPVKASNGTTGSHNDTTWTILSGQQQTMIAEAVYTDPAQATFTRWTIVMIVLAVLASALTAYLAYRNRNQAPRPKPVPAPLDTHAGM